MVLRSWSKNRKAAAMSRRSNVVTFQRRDVAETEHPDVTTLLHDVATFGVDFGWIFSPFEPIMEGFKAQTRKRRQGGG